MCVWVFWASYGRRKFECSSRIGVDGLLWELLIRDGEKRRRIKEAVGSCEKTALERIVIAAAVGVCGGCL